MIVVDVSDMALSNNPQEMVRTYALGSCIGVTLYDSELKIGGILHFQLPQPNNDGEAKRICMYANTGIPHFIHQAYLMGAQKKNLHICLVGGSLFSEKEDLFQIGLKNYLTAKKILAKNNIPLAAEDVGGTKPRTLTLDIIHGKITVQSQQVIQSLNYGDFHNHYSELTLRRKL
jgi:chemotaxis protein CheD